MNWWGGVLYQFDRNNLIYWHFGSYTISYTVYDYSSIPPYSGLKIVSEYDQEIPQSQTADNPVAPRGRAAQPSQDTRKTN